MGQDVRFSWGHQRAHDVVMGPLGPIIVGDFFGAIDLGSMSAMSTGGLNGFCAVLDVGSGFADSLQTFAAMAGQHDVGARSVALLNATGDYAISGDFGGTIDFGGGSVS